MPYSSHVFDALVARLLKEANERHGFDKILDIGAGAGKYGKIIRQVIPTAKITAVEVSPAYIERYHLVELYSEIWQMDIRSLQSREVFFDIVIIGDVIEHLPKSSGRDLLEFLVYRCHQIFVVVPNKYIQYSLSSHNPQEEHRSIWGEEDFYPFVKYFKHLGEMSLYLLQGYLSDPESYIGERDLKRLLQAGVKRPFCKRNGEGG